MKRFIELILFSIASLVCSAQDILIDYPIYRSVYNVELKVPRQVEWTLTLYDIGSAKRDALWKFITDHAAIKANHDDYTKSGYDRGHMCPAADRSRSQSLMQQTFRMSNIAPQTPALNRGAWKKIEYYAKSHLQYYDSIDVIAVPIFLNRDTNYIGTNKIAVPHAFFKAMWIHGTDSVLGSWFIFNQ